MGKKRNKLEILMDILLVVFESKDGVGKTRIMQSAYLDWRNFQKHFDFLVENDFLNVTVNGTEKVYTISKKGKELLAKLIELNRLLEKEI